jgi:O-antigen ligase
MFNQIVIGLIASYIFICAIPYTPAARYLLLGSLITASLIGLWQKRFCKPIYSSVTCGVGLFVGLAFLSAVSSPYLVDSLQGFRKEYLPPLFLLLIASCLKQSVEDKQRSAATILWALLSGFFLKTLLALWDGAINHDLIFSPYSNPAFFEQYGLPKYVSYYAVESVLYLTLAYSTLLFLAKSWWSRTILAIACGTALAILLASGIRSAFASAAVGLIIITLLKLRTAKRIFVFVFVGLTLAALGGFIGKNNTNISRYAELIQTASYSKQNGMSGRYFIWQGVSELVSERSLLGFGPGWQKIPTAASDTGLIKKWQADTSNYAQLKQWYFSLEPGKANPHNLALQVLFETGWLGMLGYIVMLTTLFWCAITAPRLTRTPFTLWLNAAAIGFGTSLFLIDITNAFLFHNTIVALMLITMLTRESANEKLRPS